METEFGGFLERNLVGGSGHPHRLPVQPHLEVRLGVYDGVLGRLDRTGDDQQKRDDREEGEAAGPIHRCTSSPELEGIDRNEGRRGFASLFDLSVGSGRTTLMWEVGPCLDDSVDSGPTKDPDPFTTHGDPRDSRHVSVHASLGGWTT